MPKVHGPALCSGRLPRRGVLAATAVAASVWLSLSGGPVRANSAGEFVIIVNKKNPATGVTSEFLSDAFLKKTVEWQHGVSLRPADQRLESPIRHVFAKTVLKRTVAAVRNYWQQRIFSGREVPPPEFDSDAAVIHYVQKHEGGVGYVSPSATLEGVKVIPYR
jgi:ABC-type phosphate transport system substrate-binding protein